MRDQLRAGGVLVTGLGQMHLVAQPDRVAFAAAASLLIIRRDDAFLIAHRRAIAPMHLLALLLVMLGEDLTQERHFGQLAHGLGRLWLSDGRQQLGHILTHLLTQQRALGLSFGEACQFKAMHIALKPGGVQMRLQPGWLLLSQGIERRTHTLPYAFQAAERTHARQDRRRIGALLASRFEPATLARQLQDRLQEQVLRPRRQHALAEVRQDRVIEARLIQRQGQGIQPINARAHRVCGLPIGQPFEGLQHRHQRQPPGGFCGSSACGEQMGKVLIAVDRTKGIAQLRHHRAFGAEPSNQQARFFRDWLQATGFHRH